MVWKNKKVLVTGFTGFKGTWLCLMLSKFGAQVYGLCRKKTHPQFYTLVGLSKSMAGQYEVDIKNYDEIFNAINQCSPDVIFHLSAQPLVKESYKEPFSTFQINTIGSLNLLESIRRINKPCIIVNVTTDKVYRNLQIKDYNYTENDLLGGRDPYSASKAAVEIISYSYCESFFKDSDIRLATARAGNVIGGGDFAPNRLIPDLVTHFLNNQTVKIRHPHFVRPWQHVLDALSGYILLAEKLSLDKKFDGAYNFGPSLDSICSVEAIVQKMNRLMGKGDWLIEENTNHEEPYLLLNSKKAMHDLGWKPKFSIDQALEKTVSWYKAYQNKEDMALYSKKEINDYLDT